MDFILIPYCAGALFVWPLFCLFRRNTDPRAARLAKVFLITLLTLGALAGTIGLVGNQQWWGTELFPRINFVSLMFSGWAVMPRTEAHRNRFSQPKFAAALAVVFVVTAMLFCVGGFSLIDIMLHEARTTATVTGKGDHGVLQYEYEVGGRTYRGAGDPGDPPYPRSSTYEIRYSSAHPYFSTAHNPMDFFGQMLVACLFMGGGAFAITRTRIHSKNEPE